MENSLRGWIERLEQKALPAMALTRQRVQQLLDSPNTTHADLQRILSRDPGFTLAIFRLFNALPVPPREPVTNLAHAIALLGIEPTTRADKPLPNLERQLTGEARTALYECYSRAGHAAWYAYSWGHDLRLGNPEEMAIAALLHELGEMLLWTHAGPAMHRVKTLASRGVLQTTAEESIFGFPLWQLSLQLAEQWSLPPLTAQALQPSGAFQLRSLVVMLATALARESRNGWQSEQTRELVELVAALHGLEPDRGRAYVHTLAAGVARNLSGLPLPLTAYALLDPATSPPKRARTSLPSASRPVMPPSDNSAIAAVKTRIATEMPPAVKHPPAAAPGPLQASLSRVFRELRETAGVERVMFAMLTPDRKTIKAKFLAGADSSTLLKQFQHPVGERHLLTLILKKTQCIWLNDKNRGQLLPLMGEPLRTALDTRGFYMGSLLIKNRPIGILYADRSDGTPLDHQGFMNFKSLAQRLCNELSDKTGSNGSASLLTNRGVV